MWSCTALDLTSGALLCHCSLSRQSCYMFLLLPSPLATNTWGVDIQGDHSGLKLYFAEHDSGILPVAHLPCHICPSRIRAERGTTQISQLSSVSNHHGRYTKFRIISIFTQLRPNRRVTLFTFVDKFDRWQTIRLRVEWSAVRPSLRSAMKSLFPPSTPPGNSPAMMPHQRNTSSGATFRQNGYYGEDEVINVNMLNETTGNLSGALHKFEETISIFFPRICYV